MKIEKIIIIIDISESDGRIEFRTKSSPVGWNSDRNQIPDEDFSSDGTVGWKKSLEELNFTCFERRF